MRQVACAGFILAGAEKYIRLGRIKIRWGRITPEGRKTVSAPFKKNLPPLAEFNSAPGTEQARGGGGAESERGRNI